MKYILSVILLSLSMANALAEPQYVTTFARPKPPIESAATATTADSSPDPKKLDEAAAIVTSLKHCLAMDGSLNQPIRLIDAYNNQPDLENLPKNLDDAAREKVMLYTEGRPDIPDFGFLIPSTWRITNRNDRIKFNSILSLKLSEKLGFKYGYTAFAGNCKPVLQGDIITRGDFEHLAINMPLAFNDAQVKLTYLMIKQKGYNWQIEDLLLDNAGVANYIRKDLADAVTTKGVSKTAQEICKSTGFGTLKCD